MVCPGEGGQEGDLEGRLVGDQLPQRVHARVGSRSHAREHGLTIKPRQTGLELALHGSHGALGSVGLPGEPVKAGPVIGDAQQDAHEFLDR